MTASQHAHSAHAHDHAAHDHAAHDHAGSPDEAMTSLLDLDGEVLSGYWSAALDWVAGAAASAADSATNSAGRLLDLGAGTGTGALGLAERFPRAEVIAVDVEPGSLARLRDKARARGLAGRVRTVAADLDAGWPDLGPLDLTWASMSLHHLAEPGRVLADALAATRPGGLIAAAEFAEPLRFLRPAAVPAGFEDRLLDRLGRAHAEALPTLGSAWAPRLAAAGWEVAGEREFPVDLDPPAHPRAAEYARAWFARLSEGLADQLEPADQATLTALLAGDGPLSPADLRIRGTRTVTLARRPR